MKLSKLLVGAAFVLSSAFATATPVFQGNYVSDGTPAMTQAGYYLWADETSGDWNLLWNGIGADINPVTWGGSITFRDSELGDVHEVKFEYGTCAYCDTSGVRYDDTWYGGIDAVRWDAGTNNTGGYDGLRWDVTANYELMSFSLTSNLFDDLSVGYEQDSVGIFIGADNLGTKVNVFDRGGAMYQEFEVSVSEPSALLLLGLGLAGLGLSRRRRVGS